MNNVVKFPFGVSRRAHSRKPRASKNGTPEERAAGLVPPILEQAREKELLRIWKCVDPRGRLAARRYLRALIVRNT
jgi:hypothetical protein